MKKIFVLGAAIFMMLLTAFVANAQEQEILKLKDGTEIKGIVERLPDGGVRITDMNGDVFVFSGEEILDVKTEKQRSKEKKIANKQMRSGYAGIVELGLGGGLDGGLYFTAGMVNCYKFNPYLYLGVGVDVGTAGIWIDQNIDPAFGYSSVQQFFILPVYTHIRYSILGGHSGKVSPYIAFNLGYEIVNGAIMVEPSAGIQIKGLAIGDLWAGIDFPLHMSGSMNIAFKVGWSF